MIDPKAIWVTMEDHYFPRSVLFQAKLTLWAKTQVSSNLLESDEAREHAIALVRKELWDAIYGDLLQSIRTLRTSFCVKSPEPFSEIETTALDLFDTVLRDLDPDFSNIKCVMADHSTDLREVPQPPAEIMAMKFHEVYERLAPEFGYETRTETRNFDTDTPNGRLMVAVCEAILDWLFTKELSDDNDAGEVSN